VGDGDEGSNGHAFFFSGQYLVLGGYQPIVNFGVAQATWLRLLKEAN